MLRVETFRELQDVSAEWHRYLHQFETAIAETGIIARVQGRRGEGPTIGLRADLDALPIRETASKPFPTAALHKPAYDFNDEACPASAVGGA